MMCKYGKRSNESYCNTIWHSLEKCLIHTPSRNILLRISCTHVPQVGGRLLIAVWFIIIKQSTKTFYDIYIHTHNEYYITNTKMLKVHMDGFCQTQHSMENSKFGTHVVAQWVKLLPVTMDLLSEP